jgi:TRAP-type C4-dicarboxylate transport system permease small subunit
VIGGLAARLDRVVTPIEDGMTLLACAAVAAMALVTAADVVFRYVLKAPFSWSHDLITHYLLIALFFLALSYVARTAGHMSLDFAVRKVSVPWLRNLFSMVGDLLGLLLAVGIAYGGWTATAAAWSENDILPGALPLPTWPGLAMVPIGAFVLALRLLCRILFAIEATSRGTIVAHNPAGH